METDLNSLSRDELEKLRKDVEKALETHDARRKAEARVAAERAAKEFGFSLDDLSGKSGKSGKIRAAKFRNPADPTQTWSGRGRQPGWLKAELQNGKTLEDFAI